MNQARSWLFISLCLAMLTIAMGSASAHKIATSPPNPCIVNPLLCTADKEGIKTKAAREEVGDLARWEGDDGKVVVQPAADVPRFEYSTSSGCGDTMPDSPEANLPCTNATLACSAPADGPGPLTRIWRRVVGQNVWQLVATTCWPDAVPGSRPSLTLAMIRDAFHNTPWAKPVITTEPKGNVTLVALDTFYKVNWSSDGFQPNEVEPIDPATMLGFQVDIRPRLDHFTYFFGDGQDFGPTSNEGGVYPSGGITHQYLKAGDYPARVDTTFAGDFRINGGPWAPIPDTVAVPGPATNVTVKTARAELVNH